MLYKIYVFTKGVRDILPPIQKKCQLVIHVLALRYLKLQNFMPFWRHKVKIKLGLLAQ